MGLRESPIEVCPGKVQLSIGQYQHALDEDPTRKVAKWYNTLASSYDELYGQEQADKHKIILEHIGSGRIGMLLDVGCGTGRFLQLADGICDMEVGVDVSRSMLLIAKNRRSARNDLVQAVSSSLPFRNGFADCIVSISTSKAGSDQSELVAESERVGKENSLLAVIGFDQPAKTIVSQMAKEEFSSKVNGRETLRVYRLNRTC